MSFSIDGKSVIVTGAANGIGLAIARHFVDQGANVMFADMDEASLVKELGEEHQDGKIQYFAGDLREKLTIANLLSATIDAFDRVDVLVNASRQILVSDALDCDDTSMEEMLQQNLMNNLRLTQLVAKRMIKQAEEGTEICAGAIINLSSIAARRAHPDLLAYSVSTAALDQLTRSMAVALASHKIRVNSVAFGSVMSASLQAQLKDSQEARQIIEDQTPLRRIASPTELTEMVQFLASDAASFVTGQVMTIDGGRTLLDPVGLSAH